MFNHYPKLALVPISEHRRVERLRPPVASDGPVDMVLDTDTYNEIDDQFALAYALLSTSRVRLRAVYAAPFVNERSDQPGKGMELSYDEILRVFERMGRGDGKSMTRMGSRQWMQDAGGAVPSDACDDLIDRAMARHADDAPLYVVAIGAPTNVSSAVLKTPEIADRVVVVWLGGHPVEWHDTWEFNMQQDVLASRVLLDTGVPLVRVPCANVAQKLRTTVPEMRHYLAGKNALCDFLMERFAEYEAFELSPKGWKGRNWAGVPLAYCKEIWDVAAVAWLVDPSWCPSVVHPSWALTDHNTFSRDLTRPLIRELTDLFRDPILGDLFAKLAGGTA